MTIELRHIDPERNRFRLYRMAEQPTLFGEVDLVIEWGRIGYALNRRVEIFVDQLALERRRRELLGRRRRHGYVVLG